MCIPALVLPTCSSEEETMKHSRTSALIAIAAVTASSLVACKNNKETAAMDSAAGRVDSAAVTGLKLDQVSAKLVGAPAQCKLTVKRPEEMNAALSQQLSQLGPDQRDPSLTIGAEYANRIVVKCP
jgi:hypothetical protein